MILLTGGTGFIGSKLANALVKENLDIALLCRPSSDYSRVSGIRDDVVWVHNSADSLRSFFENNDVSGIIHLATAYGRQKDDMFSVIDTNVFLPLKLIELAEEFGCDYFVNTDSFFTNELSNGWKIGDEVYLDNYTKSKYMFREYMRSNIGCLRIKFLNVQLQHVYGENDSSGKFVSFLKSQLQQNVKEIELTDGMQTRDWTHVDDVVEAYTILLKNMDRFNHGEFYSFEVGTGKETLLKDFCLKMKTQSGADTNLLFGKRPMQENELLSSVADNKSLCELGWSPRVNLDEGIRRLLEE